MNDHYNGSQFLVAAQIAQLCDLRPPHWNGPSSPLSKRNFDSTRVPS